MARFLASARGRAAGPTIAALRARVEALARAEVERVLGTLPGADERTVRAIRSLADAIVAKLLHAPMVALKKDAGADGEGNLVEAAHKLFGLPALQSLGDDPEKEPEEAAAGSEDAARRFAGQDADGVVVSERVVIGTRGSALARWQAEHVAACCGRRTPGWWSSFRSSSPQGDRFQALPDAAVPAAGKEVWVKDIELALQSGQVDLAVHSLKDVPAELATGLALVAIPKRADARDALVSRNGHTLAMLPAGARVGTSSLRRVCQMRALRPDLQLEVLRGNVDTRLRKVAEGVVDAAAAGLRGAGSPRLTAPASPNAWTWNRCCRRSARARWRWRRAQRTSGSAVW